MEITLKKILSIVLLLNIYSTTFGAQTFGKTFFTQRSQGSNAARENVGVYHLFPLCDMDCINGLLSATPQYTRTFKGSDLGAYLFFNGTNSMQFGPAGTANVFARNYFLNDNFSGTATINPLIQNFLVDFDFRLGLDEWLTGLYIKAHAPVVWTSWNTELTTSNQSTGTFIAVEALGNPIASASPVITLEQAFAGQTINTGLFPDLQTTLQFGRVDGKRTHVTVADVEVALGYNFVCNECAYFGANIRAIFPTGNRPDAVWLFEPIVGNGHHYELGGGIDTHYEFWNNCDSSFGIYTNANIYHMFNAKQRRIFDLTANGVGSNRLLIKRFSDPATYAGEMLFGPNVLALLCNVKNDVHVDAAFTLDYKRRGLTVDLGYNIWFRSKDIITITQNIDSNTYAIAGQTLGSGSASADNTGSTALVNGDLGAADAVNTFISNADLNVDSAATPNALSNKVFAHVGYTWEHFEYMPFLGIGGEAEFSGSANNALNQWAVWIKGGFSFI